MVKRCKERLSLCRPLDPLYAERWQTTEVGKRGGLEVRHPFQPHVDIEPTTYFDAFNAWFKLYGASATTEHLKPAASHAKKAEILRKVGGPVCAGAVCKEPALAYCFIC